MKIGYSRVSTKDQNLERQIDALLKYGCEVIYQEKLSGKDMDRPELQKMLESVQPGDIIVIQKLDRLGRSLRDLINLTEELRKREVGMISLTDNFDTTTSQGRLFFSIMGALAEFERELITERINDGIRQAKANGKKLGRPGKLDILGLANDYQTGMSVIELAKKYKTTRGNVYQHLRKLQQP